MSIDDVHPDVIDELEAELGPDLRAARDATPLPMLGVALARVFDEGLPPATAPTPVSGRRRAVRRAAVGAIVAGFFTGGLGVAGALPAPVQRAVSDVADVVGVQLPDPADDDAEPGKNADAPVVVPPTTVASTPPTSAVRPTPPSTVPPVAVDPGQGQGRGQTKDAEKPAKSPKDKTETTDVEETEEPEVELEQQGRGNGSANGRTDDAEEAVPATRGNGNGKGRVKGAVDELLDAVEDPAPGA